jgi:hypothetical protein
MEVSGRLHDPAALPPGNQLTVAIGYEASWASGPVWKLWGILMENCVEHEMRVPFDSTILFETFSAPVNVQ